MSNKSSAVQAKLSKKFVAYVCEHSELYGDPDAFLASLDQWPVKAARANVAVISAAQLCERMGIEFDPVPWCPDATYFDFETKIGQSDEHNQGLFYIGDASAMAVVEAAGIKSSDVVVDMCAAPGGKSIHALNFLGVDGTLISNDIDARRVKTLQENLDRMSGAVDKSLRPKIEVTNFDGESLAAHYAHSADVVILDAPCSGEAMMRRSNIARRQWSEKLLAKMSEVQIGLLNNAMQIVKPGGQIIYSTCTFNEVENEEVIQSQKVDIQRSARLLPHEIRGDGQTFFIVRPRAR